MNRLVKNLFNLFKPKIKFAKGTRLTSFLFIGLSMLIASAVVFGANTYYNIDTGEVVVQEIQRVTSALRATGGLIVGGSSTSSPPASNGFEVAGAGDVIFSTSGALNQTGAGQVTLTGNLDATGGVDITGANLTVGGANFSVAVATGNTTVGGTLGVTATSTFSSTVELGSAQELRFIEGGGTPTQYAALKAPDGLTTSKTYTLPQHDTSAPSGDYLLTWQSGDQLEWKDVTSVSGAGDITYVGDVASGAAFSSSTAAGTSLWFHDSGNKGKLTVTTLSADRTYTLPDLGGTITLASGTLSSGGVLFADSSGLISEDSSNLFWATSTHRLGIGTNDPSYPLDVLGAIRAGGSGTSGSLRLYSEQGATDYETVFLPNPTTTANVDYIFPANAGTDNYVLTTDGSGSLNWESASGVGALTGSGTSGRISKWTGTNTLGDSSLSDSYTGGVVLTIDAAGDTTLAGDLTVSGTGTHAFSGTLDPNYMAGYTLTGAITGTSTPNITGIGQFSGVTAVLSTSVTSPLYTGTGAVTLSSGSGDITLDPASGVIQLGTSDVIKTSGGYSIAASGEQILKEMVPIFGFDLPSRTATTSYVTLSRTIEDYPFSAAMTGTTRVHKIVIRYADTLNPSDATQAYQVSNWRVWDVTTATTTDNFDVTATPGTNDAGLEKGLLYSAAITLPGTSTNDWHLDVKLPTAGKKIQVYQIFLAAYDQVD